MEFGRHTLLLIKPIIKSNVDRVIHTAVSVIFRDIWRPHLCRRSIYNYVAGLKRYRDNRIVKTTCPLR
jgi:hypothetical protein